MVEPEQAKLFTDVSQLVGLLMHHFWRPQTTGYVYLKQKLSANPYGKVVRVEGESNVCS